MTDAIITKPSRIVTSEFGYNLKHNARINKIYVQYNAWVKNSSGGETDIPTIPGVNIRLNNLAYIRDSKSLPFYPADRVMEFSKSYISKITPDVLNNKNFSVTFNPLRNTSYNPGAMSVDYINLLVDFTDPTYSLTAKLTSPIKIGEYLTYTLTLRNTNNAHQGHGIPVSINIPDGLDYVGDNGSYYNSTHKWIASLNSNGYATIQIRLRAVSKGNKTITASVDGFNTKLNTSVNVKGANYTLSSTLPRTITQGHSFIYHVLVKSNSTLNETIPVNIPIPDGFAYVSSDPTYNEVSQVWAASFYNKKTDTVAITLEAITPGAYNQTVTSDNANTLSKKITIIPSDIGSCNYVEIPLPDELKIYMQDQKEYFVSCEMEIVSALSGEVYDGYNNFSLAVLIGEDEEEKNDEYEIIGTSPDALNIYERVFAQFVYDQNATTTIRIYGQYSGLEPGNYNVRFGKWSISNLTEDFEQSGGLINDPSLLCEDGEYAQLLLDGGESSKPVILGNIYLSGLEYDPLLIVKGLGVQLDYICDTPLILNTTITNKEQSSTQSIILDPEQDTFLLGGEGDKWDLTNIDLTDIEISVSFVNTTLDPISILLKNLQFILYSDTDQTNGNMGFTLDGEHSKNYDISLDNDSAKNEGTVKDIGTYDISNSEGELITQVDLKAKKITVKFAISGDDLEDAQNRLIEATKYLSNDPDLNTKLPIPKVMVFDWDPNRAYNVVLSEEIKVTLDTFTYKCEATFTVSEGIGWSNLKTCGAIGTNEGLIEVRPLITLLTTGGYVQIYDNISYKSVTINESFDEEIILIVDCNERTIKDSDGNDYSNNITLNSSWLVILNDFDLSNSTGCIIQKVEFKEGS